MLASSSNSHSSITCGMLIMNLMLINCSIDLELYGIFREHAQSKVTNSTVTSALMRNHHIISRCL